MSRRLRLRQRTPVRSELPAKERGSGPPGPPPRPGLAWKPETHRWIRPQDMKPQDAPKQQVEGEKKQNLSPEELVDPLENDEFDGLWANIFELTNELDDGTAKEKVNRTKMLYAASVSELGDYAEQTESEQRNSLKLAANGLQTTINVLRDALTDTRTDTGTKLLKKITKGQKRFDRIAHRKSIELLNETLDSSLEQFENIASGNPIDMSTLEAAQELNNFQYDVASIKDYYSKKDKKNASDELERFGRGLTGFAALLTNDNASNQLYKVGRNILKQASDIKYEDTPFPYIASLRDLSPKPYSIATGKPLEMIDINIEDMPLKVLSTLEDSTAHQGYQKARGNIFRQLKPEMQREFIQSVENIPPTVIDTDYWASVVSERESFSNISPETLLGYCNPEGVFIPSNANRATITHEFGHQIDRYHAINDEGSFQMRNQYQTYAYSMDKEDLENTTITPYAATNEAEYFAESFMIYLESPIELYRQDRSAYAILSEYFFQ